MNAPDDAAVRSRALDTSGSFIVQAPAGSGKTELLTRRILALLAEVDEPEQVMALTFTTKAASEMRHRVVEMLRRAGSDKPAKDAHEAEGIELARRALARDRALGWGVVEDPKRLNLRTIDSLNRSLVTGLPVVSTLGGAGDVTTTPEPLYREAARRFIAAELQALAPLLLHLDNDLERLQRLLVALLQVRDQWLRYLPLGGMPEHELRSLLESMLEDLVGSRLQGLVDAVPPCIVENLIPLLGALPGMLEAWASFKKADPKPAQIRLAEFAARTDRLPGAGLAGLADWCVIADMLLTADSKPRRSVTGAEGFPGPTNATKIGIAKAELTAHVDRMKSVLADVTREPAFVDRLIEVRTLPQPRYDDADWTRLMLVVSRLPELVTELQLVFAEQGQTDYTEVSRRAVVALGTEEDPTDLSLSMDLRLRHVLVDEFQDTSRAQVRLLERLVAGWESGDGRTLFAVGDPMQSIYRFREGDVSLFLHALDEGIAGIALEPLRLTANFRSMPAVVEWVNERFKPIFPTVSDPDLGAVTYEESTAFRDGDGGVCVHAFEGTDRDASAARVARLVDDTLRADATGTVGILLRTRSQAVQLLPALQARGIAYRAVEIDALERRPVVSDLISLAFALRHPHDRLHWLAVLRGPPCGLRLEDLHALVGDDSRLPVVLRMMDPAVRQTLSKDGRARLERFVAVVEPALHRASRERLVPWVEAIWLRLGGPAACEGASDEAAAERCLLRLMELEASGRIWERRSLRDAVEKLYASDVPDGDARVEIMTVHKSKGLEFDHVVVPGLENKGRADDKRLFEWYETAIGDVAGLLLAPIDPPGGDARDTGPLAAFIRNTRAVADRHEILRLLYVACTRARRTLHLVASLGGYDEKKERWPTPSDRSLLAPLHDTFVEAVGQSDLDDTDQGYDNDPFADVPDPVADAATGAGAGPGASRPFARTVSDWTPPDFECFEWQVRPLDPATVPRIDYDWRSDTARDVGTVVHRALQRLVDVPPERRAVPDAAGVARIERELRTLGVPEALLDEAAGQVVEAIRNTLGSECGRWILNPGHSESRTEWALTLAQRDAEGRFLGVRRLIVDRSFVDPDGLRWVVDYKTGSHEGGDEAGWLDEQVERYRDQLDGYAEALSRIDDRPLRMGLWFPMVKGWREFVPTPATPASVA